MEKTQSYVHSFDTFCTTLATVSYLLLSASPSSLRQDRPSKGSKTRCLTMELPPFQYEALTGLSQIRLVTILPGERSKTVELQLEHADMISSLKHECLSYAWGTGVRDRSKMLNHSAFLVSSSLHNALHHLRYASQERKIWIDAICINQADIAERNGHVATMRNIYQNATRVIVWIEPGTESSQQAMEFLKLMATAKKNGGRGIRRKGTCRAASDTSSELGPEEVEDNGSILGPCSSASPDKTTVEPSRPKPPFPSAQSKIKPSERPQSSHNVEALDGSAKRSKSPSDRKRLKIHHPGLYASLLRNPPVAEHGKLRSYRMLQHEYRSEYKEARVTEQATQNDFVITGFPVLAEIYGNPRHEYFKDEWDSHWQALD
jgi:hypothetical protein